MTVFPLFHPKLLHALRGYSRAQFKRDFGAGLNVMTLAFPLSMAFAIVSGVKPEQGLWTAIIGGSIIAAFGGSRVQIGGPTGAFVIITYCIVQRFGFSGLFLCTMMAGAMLCLMELAKMGSIIRFVPYPVSRAFTKGIAVLILLRDALPPQDLRVDEVPVTKLLFFIAPSPSAHLELVGQLSPLLAKGTLREVLAVGGTDEAIFQSVDAADAAAEARNKEGKV